MKTKITRSKISIPGVPSKVMQDFSTTTILKRFGVPTAIIGAALALVMHGQVSVQAQPAPSLELSPSQQDEADEADEAAAIADDQDFTPVEPLPASTGETLPEVGLEVQSGDVNKSSLVSPPSAAASKPAPNGIDPAGYDTDGVPLYICFGKRNGTEYVGKLRLTTCKIVVGRRETFAYPFTRLANPRNIYKWVRTSKGNLPKKAVNITPSSTGRPQYPCRINPYVRKGNPNSQQPGRVSSPKGGCVAGYGGLTIKAINYDILVYTNF
jgi:Protein of unknown function (DUF3421)